MPFTLAHPAAVLPIRALTRRLPLLGLFVGATVPDIAYFLALQPTGVVGHTPPGVFTEGLPAGLLLSAAWAYLAGPALRGLLPSPLAARVSPQELSVRGLPRLCVAIVVGAFTHLLWDGFTHRDGFAVVRWSSLAGPLGPLPAYSWLQYTGGLLGLFVLLWWFRRQEPAYPAEPLPCRGVLWVAVLLASGGLSAWAAHGGGSASAVVVRGVIGSISGGFAALCVVGGVIWVRARFSNRSSGIDGQGGLHFFRTHVLESAMGRTRSFQPEHALEQAMLTFWRLGYDSTAVSDLVSATGVNRHSLYTLWGDKRGLFLAALDHYLDLIQRDFLSIMCTPDADIHSIVAFGERFLAQLTQPPGSYGCLIASAASEQAHTDEGVSLRVDQHTLRLRRAFGNALRGAGARGQLRPGLSTDALTEMFVVLSRGLALEARHGADPEQLRLAISATIDAIRSPGATP